MDITMSTCSKLTKGFILYLHRVLFCFFNVSITLDKALKTPALAQELVWQWVGGNQGTGTFIGEKY